MTKYPARTRRNTSILAAIQSFKHGEPMSQIWLAGRVIGILDDGFVLQDESARMEITNHEWIGASSGRPEPVILIGDIIEVRIKQELTVHQDGMQITTNRGEECIVLAKCSSDFFIRKEDPTYLKMVIDLRLKDVLFQRAQILRGIRDFFWQKGFLEVETPELVRLPGMEPYLDVFSTTFTGLPLDGNPPKSEEMFLITSPEYAMKKLLVAGHEKIFQITKSFRNKEHESTLHNPEFTILEWYRAFASYQEIMDDIEELVKVLAQKFLGSQIVVFGQHKVNVGVPWERVKVKDLFKQFAHIEYEEFEDVSKFRTALLRQGFRVASDASYDDMFFMVFLNAIEPHLGISKPTIVYEYPAQMAALSKKCEYDPRYAERFEVYVGGMELANAFTELNDPAEQSSRLEHERLDRKQLGKQDYPVDQSFIRALEFGMPPSGGIALGIDRLVMFLTGVTDVRDVLYFPHRDL